MSLFRCQPLRTCFRNSKPTSVPTDGRTEPSICGARPLAPSAQSALIFYGRLFRAGTGAADGGIFTMISPGRAKDVVHQEHNEGQHKQSASVLSPQVAQSVFGADHLQEPSLLVQSLCVL